MCNENCGGGSSGGYIPSSEAIDNKVLEYLRRATRIGSKNSTDPHYCLTIGDKNIIEIAKMIQIEEKK